MSDNGNPLERLVGGAKEAIEHVFHPGCDRDHDHRHHHYHHQQHRHSDERTNITINVNVACCPSSHGGGTGGGSGSGPGGGPGSGSGSGSGSGYGTGRPVHNTGTSDGSVTSGLGNGGIIKIPSRPPNVWPGQRTQLFLPLLFLRANAGDVGARPVVGHFWESPDILVMPNISPANAPAVPTLADLKNNVAEAGKDNTVYVHAWNLGQAPCHDALVDFYWFNPTCGFSGKDAHLIGSTYVTLSGRSQPGSHKIVKCPFSWVATYVNGGHECLVARLSQPITDPLGGPQWDASQNRHIGQRNIHVMSAAEAAANPTIGINIGPLFGQPAQVAVERADVTTMPWLHLVTKSRAVLPGTAPATGEVGITAPIPTGAGLPDLGGIPNPTGAGVISASHGVAGDNMQVGFVATDTNPGAGNAHVYRVSAAQNGTAFGGYTVVVLGS